MQWEVLDFVEFCRSVPKHGLVVASSGNASCRCGDESNRFMITRSGLWLENMTEDDVAFIQDNETSNNPSMELPVHLAIYNRRPEAKVILHFQSLAATAIACIRIMNIPFCIIPEIKYYFNKITSIGYAKPGSINLINLMTVAFKEADIVLADNHGQFVIGESFEHVLRRAIFFEFACNLLLKIGVDNWSKVKTI